MLGNGTFGGGSEQVELLNNEKPDSSGQADVSCTGMFEGGSLAKGYPRSGRARTRAAKARRTNQSLFDKVEEDVRMILAGEKDQVETTEDSRVSIWKDGESRQVLDDERLLDEAGKEEMSGGNSTG